MSDNTDALKRGYDAFNTGDADTVAALYHDSGNEVKLPSVEVWRMSDAKAKRVQTLTDTAQMERALRR
jgi:hypothetical protein